MAIMPLEAKHIELSFVHEDGKRIVAHPEVSNKRLTHIKFHIVENEGSGYSTITRHDQIPAGAFLKGLTTGMAGKNRLRAEVFSAVHEALVKSGHVNEGSIAEGKLKLLNEYKRLTPEARR